MAKNSWDRKHKESASAWDAFKTYRDMGESRSLAKVGRELGKSTDIMERWSSRWNWVERVMEHEAHLDGIRQAATEGAVGEMAERHAQMAAVIQNKLVEALNTLKGSDIKFADIPRLFETSVKVERISKGLGYEVKRTFESTAPNVVIIEYQDPTQDDETNGKLNGANGELKESE